MYRFDNTYNTYCCLYVSLSICISIVVRFKMYRQHITRLLCQSISLSLSLSLLVSHVADRNVTIELDRRAVTYTPFVNYQNDNRNCSRLRGRVVVLLLFYKLLLVCLDSLVCVVCFCVGQRAEPGYGFTELMTRDPTSTCCQVLCKLFFMCIVTEQGFIF